MRTRIPMRDALMVAVLAMALEATGNAEEKDVYLGAGVGVSSINLSGQAQGNFGGGFNASTGGFNVAIGGHVNRHFGMEVSYLNFGSATHTEGEDTTTETLAGGAVGAILF